MSGSHGERVLDELRHNKARNAKIDPTDEAILAAVGRNGNRAMKYVRSNRKGWKGWNYLAKVEASLLQIHNFAARMSDPTSEITPADMGIIATGAIHALRALGIESKP